MITFKVNTPDEVTDCCFVPISDEMCKIDKSICKYLGVSSVYNTINYLLSQNKMKVGDVEEHYDPIENRYYLIGKLKDKYHDKTRIEDLVSVLSKVSTFLSTYDVHSIDLPLMSYDKSINKQLINVLEQQFSHLTDIEIVITNYRYQSTLRLT